jgi:hypothetical protein
MVLAIIADEPIDVLGRGVDRALGRGTDLHAVRLPLRRRMRIGLATGRAYVLRPIDGKAPARVMR